MTRNRFLGPLMLPVLLGASLALVLSPAPPDVASDARAATDRADPLRQTAGQRERERAWQQRCLRRIDYQRMEDARAEALDRRLDELEQAVAAAAGPTTVDDQGREAARVTAMEMRLSRVENAIAALDRMVREVGQDPSNVASDLRKSP